MFVLALVLLQAAFAPVDGVAVRVAPNAFQLHGDDYRIEGARPDPAAVETYRAMFVREWSLYPAGIMKKARVAQIGLCGNLSVDGQIRAAVPAFDLDTMLYDVALGANRGDYQRRVVHHEFFHMLDQRMHRLHPDREWAALNPVTFHYGSGGAKMRKPGVGDLTDQIPGFLTLYGTSAVEEDKAELFCHMIVDGTYVRIRADADQVLRAKIRLLRQRLVHFMAEMGDEFWLKSGWPPLTPTALSARNPHDIPPPWALAHRLGFRAS